MTYKKYFNQNLKKISAVLAIFFLIFYLFYNYRNINKKQFSYVENLTGSPECKSFDCSSIKDPYGTTYHKCKTGDPNCKPGQICTSGQGCVGDGEDPFGQPGHLGNDVGCCPGTKPFINNWKGPDGPRSYKCCTVPSDIKPAICDGVTCLIGQFCDPTTGQCIHDDSGCVPPCEQGETCQNGKCIPNIVPDIVPNGKSICNPPCGSGQVCQNGQCVASGGGGGGNSPTIQNQPGYTIQVVNNTSENPLHVFLGTKNNPWAKLSGNGMNYPAVEWGSSQELIAWNPVGALKLSEVIIPINGYIVLTIPQDMRPPPGKKNGTAFRVIPLKMNTSFNTPLKSSAEANSKVMKQWPILLEGGVEVVADSSAVDGINFRMKYELSGKSGYETMIINKNPCSGLDKKYQLEVGCRNPALIDCSSPTCTCCCCGPSNKYPNGTGDYAKGLCKIANQDCKFNDCSQKLFNIPDNLKQYIGKYDGGNPDDVVKKFINKTTNLKEGSPLRQFCDDIQENSGDFTAYCYDYNDVGSSPWLSSPYKMKVTYMDL